MSNFQIPGSNWRFKSVIKLYINTVVYKPLKGSSYIPLPKILADKKAIINIENKDDCQCFKWCFVRALNPIKNNAKIITQSLKLEAEKLDWTGIKFPVSLKEIYKFEERNKEIGVNVFGYEGYSYPLRLSDVSMRKQL